MTPARLATWHSWRAAAGPFARFVNSAPFVDATVPGDPAVPPVPPGRRPPPGRTAAVLRALTGLPPTTAAILDLPLATALDVVRAGVATPAAGGARPWVVLVVPRLGLPATTHPVDAIRAMTPAPPVRDRHWWREPEPPPATRAAWFVLDGDRASPPAPARGATDARHEVDADQLPDGATLRRAGYDAVAVVGCRAVPAHDLRDVLDACLDAGLRMTVAAA